MSLMNSTACMVMILSDMSKRDKMGKNKISYIENAAYCNFVIQNESTNALQIKSLILNKSTNTYIDAISISKDNIRNFTN